MRDDDEGDAEGLLDVDQLELRVLAQLLVERGERLVEQQQLGLRDEGARQRDALSLTAGELVRLALCERPELDHVEHLVDAPGDLRLGHAQLLEAERDVLLDRHVREERIGLEHHVHGLLVRRHVGHVHAVDEDLAGRRPLEAGQHAEQRRLAAAGTAQQAEDLLLVDVEGDVVDRDELAELLGDPLHLDEGLGVRIGPGLELELLVAG